MVIIKFQVFIVSNVNVYGLVSVSPPSTSTFDRTPQYFLCRLWYSKIDREISSTMCHMSLQYISQYIVLEIMIPMIYNMPYLAMLCAEKCAKYRVCDFVWLCVMWRLNKRPSAEICDAEQALICCRACSALINISDQFWALKWQINVVNIWRLLSCSTETPRVYIKASIMLQLQATHNNSTDITYKRMSAIFWGCNHTTI